MRRPPTITIVLGIALALRIAAAFGLQWYLDEKAGRPFLIPGDANGYWALGEQIANGEDYTVNDPPRRILRMPGFPLVLAMAGGNFLAARLLLAFVGTLACWWVYCLGKELLDEWIGVIAAALCAVSPAMIVFSVLILTETTFAAAMTFSLWRMARFWNRSIASNAEDGKSVPSQGRLAGGAFVIGLTVALASYVRPSWLLFGPVFALAFYAKTRTLIRSSVVAGGVVAGIVVALVPWIVRNYEVTDGRFVPTTLWVGPSLYDGLNPEATGDSDMTFFRQDHLLGRMSEYEMDREYRRRSWEFVREHPHRALGLTVPKMSRYWSPWPNASQFQRWWMIAAAILFFAVIIGPALYGSWQMRDRWDVLLLSLIPILYFCTIHSIFVGSIRYRLPAEYSLCVLTAVGILKARGRRPAGSYE